MHLFKLFNIVFIVFMIMMIPSCGIYSFSGASIPPEAKTISVHYFQNRAPLIQPTLSQTFTDALKDKFAAQSGLTLIDGVGDLAFEGEITDYSTTPVAIKGGDNPVAGLTRLTITVNVRFTNKFNEKQNFESSFSRYEDFSSTQTLSSVEDALIKKINETLVEDIFNKAVVNW